MEQNRRPRNKTIQTIAIRSLTDASKAYPGEKITSFTNCIGKSSGNRIILDF
jgi:hypothetical protein